MPSEYTGHEKWQTKDVVEPMLGTLIVQPDGRLVYEYGIYKYRPDSESIFGVRGYLIETRRDVLDYHGIMKFYDFSPNYDGKFVEFETEFNHGLLRRITVSD